MATADCGCSLVLSPGVAPAQTGHPHLTGPLLLGREQNGETQKGKTLSGAGYASLGIEGGKIMDTKQVVTNYHNAWTSGDVKAARVYLERNAYKYHEKNT